MIVRYVAILPSIYPPWTGECLASCKLDNLLVVDNTTHNRGVAASWNLGIREMYERGADWLIIVSAGVRFGEPGGLDLVAEMGRHPGALAVEAGVWRWNADGTGAEGFGWHLVAMHRRLFDNVGLFDENFYPAYWEDNDFGYRVKLWLTAHPEAVAHCGSCHTGDAGEALRHHVVIPGHRNLACPHPEADWREGAWWPKVHVEGKLAGTAHGTSLGGVRDDPERLMAYYARKWGGQSGHETYDHPFNDPSHDLKYWTAV